MALSPKTIHTIGKATVSRALEGWAPGIVGTLGGVAVGRALSGDEEAERPLSTDVRSTAISNVSWKDEVITVTFHRGGTYDYPGSRELYLDFISAPSTGAYFNQHIKPLG